MDRNNQTVKWLSGLFFLALVSFVLEVVTDFTIHDRWVSWVQKALSAGIVVCLYCLHPMEGTYRFSAICQAVTVLLSFATLLWGTFLVPALTAAGHTVALAILTLAFKCLFFVIWAFSVLGACLEKRAHSLLVSPKEPAFAVKWRRLFFWQLAFSALFSIGTAVTTALSMRFQWDTATVAPVWAILQLPVRIVQVVYLNYLHKTIRLVRE